MVKPCFQHEVRGRNRLQRERLPLTITISPPAGRGDVAFHRPRRRQHPVEALVILVMGHGVDPLLVVGNADRDDFLRGAEPGQRSVVKAAAVAEPVALRIEGQQRREHNVRLDLRRARQRLADAPRDLGERVLRLPGTEEKRRALPRHHGKSEPEARARKLLEKGQGIDLLADRQEARDQGGRRDAGKSDAMTRNALAGLRPVAPEGFGAGEPRRRAQALLGVEYWIGGHRGLTPSERKVPRWPLERLISPGSLQM